MVTGDGVVGRGRGNIRRDVSDMNGNNFSEFRQSFKTYNKNYFTREAWCR